MARKSEITSITSTVMSAILGPYLTRTSAAVRTLTATGGGSVARSMCQILDRGRVRSGGPHFARAQVPATSATDTTTTVTIASGQVPVQPAASPPAVMPP